MNAKYLTRAELAAELAKNTRARSFWGRAVAQTAAALVSNEEHPDIFPAEPAELERDLLNGAENWHDFSWGGSWLIFDAQIAAAFCSPSELKKTRNGARRPNAREEWLDVQARALFQAARLVKDAAAKITATANAAA